MSESFDAVDVIVAKRDGHRLSDAQIDWVIDAYTRGAVAEEQMSALNMAILLNGMDRAEIARWTAAMILGRWSPKGALAAALLFGFANNLQLQLSIIQTPIPSQIMLMTPYIVTIFAVAGLVGRVRPPAAEGIPYTK